MKGARLANDRVLISCARGYVKAFRCDIDHTISLPFRLDRLPSLGYSFTISQYGSLMDAALVEAHGVMHITRDSRKVDLTEWQECVSVVLVRLEREKGERHHVAHI